CHRQYATGAMPMGVPGWPDWAFWTASMQRVRIVLTQSRSRSCGSLWGMGSPPEPVYSMAARRSRTGLEPATNSEANRTLPSRRAPGSRGSPWRLNTGTTMARCSLCTRGTLSATGTRPRSSMVRTHVLYQIPDATPPSSRFGRRARRRPQRVQRPAVEVADALDGDVGRRLPRERRRVVGVVALAREYRGDPLPPVRLDRGAEPRLVVDEDVVLGWKARLDVVQLQLLVHVDQDVALDRLEQARVLHLERLEHDVPVGEDGGRAPRARVLDCVERAGEESVGERVAQEKHGDGEQVGTVRILDPESLQGAEVVRIPQLLADLLEQLPVPILLILADGPPEMPAHVGDDVVVVEERVVDVEERHHRGARHRALYSTASALAPPPEARAPPTGATAGIRPPTPRSARRCCTRSCDAPPRADRRTASRSRGASTASRCRGGGSRWTTPCCRRPPGGGR